MGINTYGIVPNGAGHKTATAGTTFQHNIDGHTGGRIAITAYEAAGGHATSNSITFMRVASSTTTSAAAAAAQATIVLTAALTDWPGNAIAASDIVVVQQSDGSYHFSTVSSWTSGTKTLVLNDNFTQTVLSGAKVWCFGVATDAAPATSGGGHQKVQLIATATSANNETGLFFAKNTGDPMIVFHNNATTAGSINYLSWWVVNV